MKHAHRFRIGDRCVIARGFHAPYYRDAGIGVVWSLRQTPEEGVVTVEYPDGRRVSAYVEDVDPVDAAQRSTARQRYIRTLRSMHPDAVLSARIDALEAEEGAAEPTQERPETAPEGDGTTDPISGAQGGAQRFKVGDRVQVVIEGLLGNVVRLDEGNVGVDIDGCPPSSPEDWRGYWYSPDELEPLPPVEPDAVEAPVRELDYEAWQLAPVCTDPLCCPHAEPEPITELPTTPASVAWTRDGEVFGHVSDDEVKPWWGVRYALFLSAQGLLARGVVRTFDAGTGQVRVFDAGTVA